MLAGDSITTTVTGGSIVTDVLAVIGEVGQGVIALAGDQKLTVVLAFDNAVHALIMPQIFTLFDLLRKS